MGDRYTIHGICATLALPMIIVHVYFVLRPEHLHSAAHDGDGLGDAARISRRHRYQPLAAGGAERVNAIAQPGIERAPGAVMELGQHIETIEEAYEFMLAYAAQGRRATNAAQRGRASGISSAVSMRRSAHCRIQPRAPASSSDRWTIAPAFSWFSPRMLARRTRWFASC